PAGANLPASVTVLPGSTSATFSVRADSVSVATAVTLTASYTGTNKTFGLTVNPAGVSVSAIWVTPGTLVSGQSGIATVTLTGAAGSGGAVISLSSSNPSLASVPKTVTVVP